MRASVHCSVGALALVFVSGTVAQGQSCGSVHYGCSPEAHTLPVELYNTLDNPHDTCNICPGSIYNCHFSCGNFAVLTRDAMASIVNAAGRGDVATVLLLAPIVGDLVRYNQARQAVQIMSCSTDGGVVASLRVQRGVLLALAARLPRSRVDTHLALGASSR